jgi:hypothetical protein
MIRALRVELSKLIKAKKNTISTNAFKGHLYGENKTDNAMIS